MIQNFTDIITWFKELSSSVLTWFFDLTSTTKILLFVAPLFVVGAIAVIFDVIIPMIFDPPHWIARKKLNVLSPRTNLNLKADKSLISMSPRRLLPFRFRRVGDKLVNNSAYTLKDSKVSHLQGLKPVPLKSTSLNSFKASGVPTFSMSELRPVSENEIKVMSTKDLKNMLVSSRKVSSHTVGSRSVSGLSPKNSVGRNGISPNLVRNTVDYSRVKTRITKDAIEAGVKLGNMNYNKWHDFEVEQANNFYQAVADADANSDD